MSERLSVILHGGAGRFNREVSKKKLPYLKQALDAAWQELCNGKPGEFAVAAALRIMEGCEYFNAGYGGYPNIHGIVLLDVGLMRGTREFVSLINLRRVKYPSAVALDMMHQHDALITIWTHELMQELDGAPEFVKERYGYVETHEDLVAPFVKELLADRSAAEVSAEAEDEEHGTVGCVVRDGEGALYSGTSTGGVHLKYNGRVGDTPIVGSGVFADNEIGALSTTGHGESFLGSMLSGFVVAEMRRRLRDDPAVFEREPELLKTILESEMQELERKSEGKGGAIVVIPCRGGPVYANCSKAASLAMRVGDQDGISEEFVRTVVRDEDDLVLEL